jgi:sulfopyruvate decarboxylase alpha subunit
MDAAGLGPGARVPEDRDSKVSRSMSWAQTVVNCLKAADIRFLNYLPDAMGEQILRIARQDSAFELLPLAREEEGVGVVCGQALGGVRGALVMPVSGLGNSINALASLAVPYKFSLPMIIAHRGDLGEFNPTQVTMGQTAREILHALRIPYFELTQEAEVQKMTEGALRITYATEGPVALFISTQVAGWKE